MKAKVRVVFYLPRRLYRILEDVMPLFLDVEADDPKRGAMTRALEYILQQYMESEDYCKKVDFVNNMRWRLFDFFAKKENELSKKSKEKK